jgi:DNA polymerase-3 subunit delta'
VFILLTDNPEKLLPTVRSRCTELTMTALPETVLREQLRQQFPQADAVAIQAAVGRSGGFLGQAKEILEEGSDLPPQTAQFLTAYASRNTSGLMETLVPMEKYKRDALIETLTQWVLFLEGALVHRSGAVSATPMAKEIAVSRSGQELLSAIEQLQKTIEYAQGNVSPAAICGYLAWALR